MAKFIPPEIQDNANGWGPCQLPNQFKDMPYQPFSKADRLGKASLSCTWLRVGVTVSLIVILKVTVRFLTLDLLKV